MAEAAEVYTRPEGMSDKQEEIIQYVAKYVVASCDSAQYQKKLKLKTKYNSYFAFLNVKHPYHGHYTYLVQSYRYWKEQMAAMEQNNLLSGAGEEEEMHMGTAPIHSGSGGARQHAASQYGGNYDLSDGQANATDAFYNQQQPGELSAFGAADDPTAPPPAVQPSHGQSSYPQQSLHDMSATRHDGSRSRAHGSSWQQPHSQGAAEEEDGEEEYEMVVQNGVTTLVPKRR